MQGDRIEPPALPSFFEERADANIWIEEDIIKIGKRASQ